MSEKKLLLLLEVNQRRWLEESGQWLENVDRTHLVLVGGNPVLQKGSCCHPSIADVNNLSSYSANSPLRGL